MKSNISEQEVKKMDVSNCEYVQRAYQNDI